MQKTNDFPLSVESWWGWLEIIETSLEGCTIYSASIQQHDPTGIHFVERDEYERFAVQKRKDEHLSARKLLGDALVAEGYHHLDDLVIVRDNYRAPHLRYLQGIWKNDPLPSISISHSGGRCFVAIGPSHLSIGVDGEPFERTIPESVFDMMASGEELESLRMHPHEAHAVWTAKEAVQKAMGLGMHLNPRKIKIYIGEIKAEISIEKSKIQLEYLSKFGYQITLAWKDKLSDLVTEEDALIEATREAMIGQDWTVGCAQSRQP